MDSTASEASSKVSRGRYVWKRSEEDCLMRCMRDSISDMWKAENGFKAGFFILLEKEMLKSLPGTKIRSKPHIESKIKNLKTQYNQLSDILRLSGFAWNDATHSIVVEPSVWEEYEKANPKVKGMYGKSFPYYEDWLIIFGKDRATGELAEDAVDAAAVAMEKEADLLFQDCYIPDFSAFGVGDNASPRTGEQSTPPENASQKQGKKRSRSVVEEAALNDALVGWLGDTSNTLSKMGDSMGYSKQLSASRQKVYDVLDKLDLTLDEKFKASANIGIAEERVDNFYSIPDHVKQKWVESLLKGAIYPLLI